MSDAHNMDELLASLRNEFVDEAEDNLNSIEILLENLRSGQEEDKAGAVNLIRRHAHSLKGSSGVADFPLVTVIMHRLEDYLNGVEELSIDNINDVQIFTDSTRKYSNIEIDQLAIATSDLVRKLPDRNIQAKNTDNNSKDNNDYPVIEAMLITREKMAGMIFKRTLSEAGLRVTTVKSSFEAIEMAVRTKPDIIICSGVMDILSGTDISCALKAMPATTDIPICILTSFERGHRELKNLRDDVYLINKSTLQNDLQKVLTEYKLT